METAETVAGSVLRYLTEQNIISNNYFGGNSYGKININHCNNNGLRIMIMIIDKLFRLVLFEDTGNFKIKNSSNHTRAIPRTEFTIECDY